MSIYRKKSQVDDALAGLQNGDISNTFSIMATNQLIEIPEKTKLDIFLKEGEEKYLLVDLKYAMDR